MAMPTGATSVVYSVNQYGESVEITQSVTFQLQSADPLVLDAAAEAAMESFVASLQTAAPSVPVNASRQYTCLATGDTWPTP